MRTFFIWLCGLLAAAIVGGTVGNLLDPSPYGGVGMPFGVLGGAFAFACVTLWLAPRRSSIKTGALLFVAAIAATSARAGDLGVVGSDWVKFKPPGEPWHVFAPPSWSLVPSSDEETKLDLRSPMARGLAYSGQCVVVVLPTPQTRGQTQLELDSKMGRLPFPQKMIEFVQSMLRGVTIQQKGLITINGRPSWFMHYDGEYQTKSVSNFVVGSGVALYTPGIAYDVTCVATDATETSTPEQAARAWRVWQSDMNGILSSFEFDTQGSAQR
jgi:hypothetical protein